MHRHPWILPRVSNTRNERKSSGNRNGLSCPPTPDVEHTEGYPSRRIEVAQAIDAAITVADFPGASADWKKLYSPGMMDAERARSEERLSDKLLRTSDILVDPVTGNPDAHARKGKKRPATGNINPSSKKKKTKP